MEDGWSENREFGSIMLNHNAKAQTILYMNARTGADRSQVYADTLRYRARSERIHYHTL